MWLEIGKKYTYVNGTQIDSVTFTVIDIICTAGGDRTYCIAYDDSPKDYLYMMQDAVNHYAERGQLIDAI